MQPNIIPLEAIQIAKPCRADWDKMTGDQRARFCGSCHKNVYDISQMTREEAHQLIQKKEGGVCVRLYRRPDGTVITSDCPVGKREAARPMWWTLAGFIALMASGATVWSQPATTNNQAPRNATPLLDKARQLPVVSAIVNKVSPQVDATMGDIAVAPPTAATPSPTPSPTGAPIMENVRMGRIAMPAPTVVPTPEPLMGEAELICEEAPRA